MQMVCSFICSNTALLTQQASFQVLDGCKVMSKQTLTSVILLSNSAVPGSGICPQENSDGAENFCITRVPENQHT